MCDLVEGLCEIHDDQICLLVPRFIAPSRLLRISCTNCTSWASQDLQPRNPLDLESRVTSINPGNPKFGLWTHLGVTEAVHIQSSHLTPTLSVRGHNMKFLIPYARTFTYQKSFFPDTIRMWNSLPQKVVSCSTASGSKCNLTDYARLVMIFFTCTVNRYFSHHLNYFSCFTYAPVRWYANDGVSTL